MVICLERGADLHTAQLMPLPLTVSCFSKIQIGFTFWYRLTRVVPEKGPLNVCVVNYHSRFYKFYIVSVIIKFNGRLSSRRDADTLRPLQCYFTMHDD